MKDQEYAECFDKLILDMKSSNYSIFDRWNAEDIARLRQNEEERRKS